MKKTLRNKIAVAIAFLLLGFGGGWLIFHNGNATTARHDHKATEEAATVWTCSMHPQIKQPEPGPCPICGMDLIPIEKVGETAAPTELEMSPEDVQIAAIQTSEVKAAVPVKTIELLGKVRPDERLVAAQTAHFPGRIERLYVNFTGQKVVKGQRLAAVYSPRLVTAQEELLEAMKYKDSNPVLLKAARQKLKLWKLTDAQIAAIEQGGAVQTEVDVLSDYSGYVTELNVAVGDHAHEGHVLMTIVDLSRVWVEFDAYESDIAWIDEGDNIEFTIASLPGKKFQSRVTFIDPVLDPEARAVKVRTEISNPRELLKRDLFAKGTVNAQLAHRKKELLAPKTAVLWTGKRAVVYIKKPGRETPTFEYRVITLGTEAGDHYVVEAGLAAGEQVVTHGVFKVDAAAQLQGKPSMMNPEGHKTPTDHDHHHPEQMEPGATFDESARKTISFYVYGNCSMCKTRIEGVLAKTPGVFSGHWEVDSKQATVIYNPEQISEAEIHQRIAGAGHDTKQAKADYTVYENLPGCCQYTRER